MHRQRLAIELLEDRRLLSNGSWPLPLEAVNPPGSLIYESSVSADLAAPDETDRLTIELDEGQTVTVVIDPEGTLQSRIELFDPGNVLIGGATSGAAGEDAVFQAVPLAVAGTYTVSVGGASGTTGEYTAHLILNAAVEQEEHGGLTNDALGSAQDLDPSFIALDDGPGERGAVLGGLAPSRVAVVDSEDFESGFLGGQWTTYSSLFEGRIRVTDEYGAADGSYALLMDCEEDNDKAGTLNEAIWTVDLSGVNNAMLSFSHAEWYDIEDSFNGDFTGHSYADGVAISDNGVNWHPVWSPRYQSSGQWEQYTVDLAAAARVAGMTLGADFQIKFQQFDYYSLPSDGRGYDQITITTPEQPEQPDDWFGLTLHQGEAATLVMTAPQMGNATLRLYDAEEHLLAAGVPGVNLSQVINNYVASSTGTYYAKVSGADVDYHLVVTRNADFDTEWNNPPDTAQPLTGTTGALGYLAGPAPGVLPGGGATGDAASEPVRILATPADGEYAPNRLIVRFADSVSGGEKARIAAKLNGKVVRELPLIHGAVIELAEAKADVLQAAAAWSADPSVVYAELDYRVTALDTFPNDPSFSDLWGMHNTGQTGGTPDADIDAPEAWNVFTGSPSVVIASIDTGVDYNHEDLAANMWVNPGEIPGDRVDNDGNGYVDDVFGIDPANWDADPWDDRGHGTHTAGTIGAVGDNGIGVTGVNWDVRIMALKFLDAGGSGWASDAIICLDYMTMMKTAYGVNVVASNNSWGGGSYSQSLKDAIQASTNAGILFVAAAGNERDDLDQEPHYPAAYDLDGIISVAATDHNDQRASFSNWGAISCDLGAPGVDILSSTPGNRYAFYDGTSMAAPHVAGAVGWLAAYRPSATPAELKAAILEGTDPLPALNEITVSGGRLNLAGALATMGDLGDYYQVEVREGDTLVFGTSTPGTDEPGEFNNSLDPALELYDPAGVLVASDDNGAGDGRNAELTYTAGTGGTYTVRVLSVAERGEYVLQLGGNTGSLPPFTVVGSSPADGEPVPVAPATFTVDFNDMVLATSLDASDLTVDNVPAMRATLLDGDTAVFELPSGLAEGTHQAAIAAGAILDLQGTPIEAFSGTFSIDTTPPRVVASTVLEGDVVPTGTLSCTVRFDEQLNAIILDPADVHLMGLISKEHEPTQFHYQPSSSTLALEFENLPEDAYTLTLYSGAGGFEDLLGHDLDGEPDPSATVPSGDGTAGGDFVVNFHVDRGPTPYPLTLSSRTPLGSLVYDTSVTAVIGTDDTDRYVIELDDGQTITAAVDAGETLQPTIELLDPLGVSIASGTAGAAGEGVVLQVVATSGPGTYTMVVGGASASTGRYAAQLVLNAAVVNETYGGPANDDPASAQDLDDGFIAVGDGSAQRGAVLAVPPARPDVTVGEDFESGTLDEHWTTYTQHSGGGWGLVEVTGRWGAAGGTFALMMDAAFGDGT